MKPIINIAAITLFVVALVVPLLVPGTRDPLFRVGGYYLILGLFLAWLVFTLYHLREVVPDWKAWLRRHSAALGVAALLTTLTFVSVNPKLRVLHDEASLLSVSQAMTYDRSLMSITGAESSSDYLTPVEWSVPDRPALFPFLVHLAHVVFGYRVANAFLVNFLGLLVLLIVGYLLLLKVTDRRFALLGMLLLVTQPVICKAATSAHYDFWNLNFLIFSFGRCSVSWRRDRITIFCSCG